MAKKRVVRKASLKKNLDQDFGDDRLMAFIATFLSIIGFIIILVSGNKNKYVRFYAKQSLVVFIFAVFAFIIGSIALFIPIIGNIIYVVLNALVIAAWVVSWVFALLDKENEVPIIGKYGRSINI